MSAGARGLVVAAPRSGSGKTTLTLGLLAALRGRGVDVAPAKTGPDYIDLAILARAAGRPAVSLDPWAMAPARLHALAAAHAGASGLLLVEGVMGLFDGAVDGTGSTGDLAAELGLPVLLVLDAARQGQSVAALASGFCNWREDVNVAAVVLNAVGSPRHERMLRSALADADIACLGALPKSEGLRLPERHLGLVLPEDLSDFASVAEAAGRLVAEHIDLDALLTLAGPLAPAREAPPPLPPLGGHVAVARDRAFAFAYPHMLEGWRAMGAVVSIFSPLADEAPSPDADAVFLPGGYPELHAEALGAAARFRAGLFAARARGALIYGECGGLMALGTALVDASGTSHEMAGLLPLVTRIDRPRRVLGYRRLAHESPLPWPARLMGHEFHYSSSGPTDLPPLFAATDALGEPLAPMGMRDGRVMGSYAHVIDYAAHNVA